MRKPGTSNDLADRPNEAQEFTGDCDGGLLWALAACAQMPVTFVQSVLRLPRDRTNLPMNAVLSATKRLGRFGYKASVPGRLN